MSSTTPAPASSIPTSSTTTTTSTTTTKTTKPLTSDQQSDLDPGRTAAAKEALTTHLNALGTSHFAPLQSRAKDISQNSTALATQETKLQKETRALEKERVKLEQEAELHQKKLKELGDVQNWAEVLERDLRVLEETVRLGEGEGEEDLGWADNDDTQRDNGAVIKENLEEDLLVPRKPGEGERGGSGSLGTGQSQAGVRDSGATIKRNLEEDLMVSSLGQGNAGDRQGSVGGWSVGEGSGTSLGQGLRQGQGFGEEEMEQALLKKNLEGGGLVAGKRYEPEAKDEGRGRTGRAKGGGEGGHEGGEQQDKGEVIKKNLEKELLVL